MTQLTHPSIPERADELNRTRRATTATSTDPEDAMHARVDRIEACVDRIELLIDGLQLEEATDDAADALAALLEAAPLIDRATRALHGASRTICRLADEEELGERHDQLRAQSGVDKVDRAAEVLLAWIGRVRSLNWSGDAAITPDALRAELVGGTLAAKVNQLGEFEARAVESVVDVFIEEAE